MKVTEVLTMIYVVFMCLAMAVDGHATATGIHDNKHCPLCNMWVKDDNLTWFTELKNGQKIYTCGMTNGTQYQRGKNSFSHPSLVGASLGTLVVPDGTGCDATCPECDDPSIQVLDPITGTKVSSSKFSFLCLKKGQKIYFESDTSKQTFLDGAQSKSYFGVASMTCNESVCPDSFQEVPAEPETSAPTPTTTLRGSDGSSTSVEPFCSGSSAMFSGFQTTVNGTCVKLLFQPWVLNSKVKYAFGFIGVFLLPLLNEYVVFAREALRQSFRRLPNKTLMTKRVHKLILTTLYMAQMTIAYFAMLIVMIYDTGLFISLIAGFGFGYAYFKSYKEAKEFTPPSSHSSAGSWRFQQFESMIVLQVLDMKCMANCGSTVQRALESLPGVELVYVEMADKCVYVAAGPCSTAQLVDTIDAIGFQATVLREPKGEKQV